MKQKNRNETFYFIQNKTLKTVVKRFSQSQSVSVVYGLARKQRIQTAIDKKQLKRFTTF